MELPMTPPPMTSTSTGSAVWDILAVSAFMTLTFDQRDVIFLPYLKDKCHIGSSQRTEEEFVRPERLRHTRITWIKHAFCLSGWNYLNLDVCFFLMVALA